MELTTRQENEIRGGIADDMRHNGGPQWMCYADGGYRVIVTEVEDPYTSLEDFVDCYGKVDMVLSSEERPDGFDGSAKKINTSMGQYWWQPPKEIIGNADAMRVTQYAVQDILDYGFRGYEMRITSTCECCNQQVEQAFTATMGWEPFCTEHGEDIVDSLLSTLEVAPV